MEENKNNKEKNANSMLMERVRDKILSSNTYNCRFFCALFRYCVNMKRFISDVQIQIARAVGCLPQIVSVR